MVRSEGADMRFSPHLRLRFALGFFRWGQHVDRAENGNILIKEEGDELGL